MEDWRVWIVSEIEKCRWFLYKEKLTFGKVFSILFFLSQHIGLNVSQKQNKGNF